MVTFDHQGGWVWPYGLNWLYSVSIYEDYVIPPHLYCSCPRNSTNILHPRIRFTHAVRIVEGRIVDLRHVFA